MMLVAILCRRSHKIELMSQEQEQKDVTLSDFVNANDKMLAATGIFGGLTLFFTAIENGEVFYFISLFIFFVLVRELNIRFPSWRVNTIGLFLFRILCLVLFFGVFAYSSYVYFFTLGPFPFFIFLLCVIVFVGLILQKIKDFFQHHKT
jgi:hypothetical protein